MPSTRPSNRVFFILGLGIISISFSAILVRLAAVPGPVAAFGRMGVTVAFLTPAALARWHRNSHSWRQRDVQIAVLAGLFFGADLTLWSTGIMLAGATTPTIMSNTAPLWVGLGAMLLFKERPPALFWTGLAVTMVGSMAILGQDAVRGLSFGVGTFLGLLAGLFYAGYFLLTQQGRESLDALTFFWVATLSGTLALGMVMLAPAYTIWGYSEETYLYLLAMGLVAQFGGQMSLNYTLGYLPASTVAPIGLLQPVLTAVWAVLLLGERLTSLHVAGGLAIIAGIYIVVRARTRTKAATGR